MAAVPRFIGKQRHTKFMHTTNERNKTHRQREKMIAHFGTSQDKGRASPPKVGSVECEGAGPKAEREEEEEE